jgi:hypothetical protein
MWTLLLVLGCAKEVPPHLRPIADTPPHQSEASLSSLVGADPLVRRPSPREAGDWQDIEHGEFIEHWARKARSGSTMPSDWVNVEAHNRGTIAVPLARGARLSGLEVIRGEWDLALERSIAAWLGLSRVEVRPSSKAPANPLAWLSGSHPQAKLATARHIATRSVLLGWLDGPEIPLEAAAKALRAPTMTGLADSPLGRLIDNRASKASDAQAAAEGTDLLWTATTHALAWAAADRDSDQNRLRKERDAFRSEHQQDPVSWHLHQAYNKLLLDAGNPSSVALALVAYTGTRMNDTCTDAPCEGLDKMSTLVRSDSWSPTNTGARWAWSVIATKEALDTLEASLDKPSLYRRLPEVADTLTGLNGGAVDLAFIRHRVPSPALFLTISRLADGVHSSQVEGALRAVKMRLIAVCDQALGHPMPTDTADQIRRIRRQAKAQL